jgi:hypothetical protein
MPPPFAPPPRVVVPTTGSLEARVRVLATVVDKKADQTTQPMFNSVLLQAPGGAVWRVSVNDAGALQTAVVPRS